MSGGRDHLAKAALRSLCCSAVFPMPVMQNAQTLMETKAHLPEPVRALLAFFLLGSPVT